jgi:RP/EB family microtubule-associated protein
MMDAGYFVGRKEIMDWINEALLLNLDKVEQTANGAIACQLLDIIFPGAFGFV